MGKGPLKLMKNTETNNERRSLLRLISAMILGLVAVAATDAQLPQLGIQTWTCRNLSFDEMVAFADEHDLTRIQLYRAHIDPADPANINVAKLGVMRAHGLEPYAMYAGMGRDDEEDRQMFALARQFGMKFLVVEPKDQSKWPQLLAAAKEHGMGLAVHNHDLDSPYGDPATVHKLLKKYPELKVCLDVGWVTAAGFDAEEIFRSYGDRVIDLHFKDKRVTFDAAGRKQLDDTLPGEGDVNFAGLFAAIRETGWAGTMVIETDSTEFAKDPKELVQRSQVFFEAKLNSAGMPVTFDYSRDAGNLPARFPLGISDGDTNEVRAKWGDLVGQVSALRKDGRWADDVTDPLADIEMYLGQVRRTLRYESELNGALVALVKSSLNEGLRRAEMLWKGDLSWRTQSERILRGYRSEIDGSAQPYGVVVPASYDGSRPVRLDVVLHGSIRSYWGSASLRFANWIHRYGMGWRDPEADYIELYPMGRITNGYRFAGHEDVYDAIDAVCREYQIDRDQIMLRGFSMGASGTWHVGLKRPDYFAALGPYMGYVDTRFFAEGGGNARLIRIGELPDYQERVLPTMDAISYAANAESLPIIAAMGGADPGIRNHEFMAKVLAKEGVQMNNLVAPGVGHRVDKTMHRAQVDLMAREAQHRRSVDPKRVHFVTQSLRYSRSHWVELLGLSQHDSRAEIVAKATASDRVDISVLRNITRFAVKAARLAGPKPIISIYGQEIVLDRAKVDSVHGWVVGLMGGRWQQVVLAESMAKGPGRKRPGIQGPIDDAFTHAFLCVRGTGTAWNQNVANYADEKLNQFAYEWNRYWAGELPIKDDRDVTAEDIRTKNLILFGDPSSNSLIARVMPDLPVTWDKQHLTMAGEDYDSAENVPVMIYPSPLDGAKSRYVVLNTGHTFGEAASSSVAYLIYPRLGDWAVWSLDNKSPRKAGHFDEMWQW